MDRSGTDVTAGFRAGAQAAVDAARDGGCAYALLTDASPSCGTSLLYDGTFGGHLKAGQGVTAAALERAGVRCFAPARICELAELLQAGA